MGWTALLDKYGYEIGIVGDEPWDIMGNCKDMIASLYIKKFGRKPNDEEMMQIFSFVMGFSVQKAEGVLFLVRLLRSASAIFKEMFRDGNILDDYYESKVEDLYQLIEETICEYK